MCTLFVIYSVFICFILFFLFYLYTLCLHLVVSAHLLILLSKQLNASALQSKANSSKGTIKHRIVHLMQAWTAPTLHQSEEFNDMKIFFSGWLPDVTWLFHEVPGSSLPPCESASEKPRATPPLCVAALWWCNHNEPLVSHVDAEGQIIKLHFPHRLAPPRLHHPSTASFLTRQLRQSGRGQDSQTVWVYHTLYHLNPREFRHL